MTISKTLKNTVIEFLSGQPDLLMANKQAPTKFSTCLSDELFDASIEMIRDDVITPTQLTPLNHKRLSVSRANLTNLNDNQNEVLQFLIDEHHDTLTSLFLDTSTGPDEQAVHNINRAVNLQTLSIGSNGALSKFVVCSNDESSNSLIFTLPNLRNFSMYCSTHEDLYKLMFDKLVSKYENLVHLELMQMSVDWPNLVACFHKMSHLQFLCLPDVPIDDLNQAFSGIAYLKKLRHLDLSCSIQTGQCYKPDPEPAMSTLIRRLPILQSLDVSGTNLAGHVRLNLHDAQLKGGTYEENFPIFGGRHFEYLGLFRCLDNACGRQMIPASKVAGDTTAEQLLVALDAYGRNRSMLSHVMQELYQWVRDAGSMFIKAQSFRDRALALIRDAIWRHIDDKEILMPATAVVFYFLRLSRKPVDIPFLIRQQLVHLLIKAARRHSEPILRNSLLCLCYVDTPGDVLKDYRQLVSLLLDVLDDQRDEWIQNMVVFFYNKVVCAVDYDLKRMVGCELRGIERIMKLIRWQMGQQTGFDVLLNAWSSLWNVTDETDCNCEQFLRCDGLQLFHDCYEQHRALPSGRFAMLARNMMGLMGNISEVRALRPQLMQTRFVELFVELLGSSLDGIEVSYNAAGVLANLVSDGVDAWTCEVWAREHVQREIFEATERWSIETRERSINYRSFRPILRLLHCDDAPAAQQWACWALGNLTTINTRYCQMVREEAGVPVLIALAANASGRSKLLEFIELVLKNVRDYERSTKPQQSVGDENDRTDDHQMEQVT